jgi:hypothetical protein
MEHGAWSSCKSQAAPTMCKTSGGVVVRRGRREPAGRALWFPVTTAGVGLGIILLSSSASSQDGSDAPTQGRLARRKQA